MLARLPNWPERLGDFLTEAHRRPYDPLTWNCALFVFGAIEAQTGTNPAKRFARNGVLRDEKHMQQIIAKHGGVRGIATRVLGEPIPIFQARRGDLIVAEGEDDETLGVMDSARAVVLARDGLSRLRLDKARAAWSVG